MARDIQTEIKYLSPAAELERYWDALYADHGGIPSRERFSPKALSGKALRQMVLLEYQCKGCDEDPEICVRLTGTAIDDVFGAAFGTMGPFGTNSALTRDTLARFFSSMRKGRYLGLIERSVGRHGDHEVTTFTRLLPLLGERGTVEYLVGTIQLDVAAYEALGLSLRVSHTSLAVSHPRRVALYDVRRRDRMERDLALQHLETSGNGLWTSAARIA